MTWIPVVAIGVVLSLVGFVVLAGRLRRNEIRGRYLMAVGVGYASLVAFAVLSALRPHLTTGPVTLAVLLPAFVAIVILIREHERAGDATER